MDLKNKAMTWKVALAYALPNFGLAIMTGPIQGVLQGYYTKHFAITMAQIGGILFLARVIDAVLDPVIGMVSDNVRDRFWGRRSWLVAGASLSLLAVYHLLVVPPELTFAYCRLWIILGFISWTISEIPYLAWGMELTSDYDDRTKIFSYKTALGFIGATLFLALPNIIAFYQIHMQGMAADQITRDFSHTSMHVSFWLIAITMPLFVGMALWVCPGGSRVKRAERKSVGEILRILFSNKAMLIFMGSFAILGIAGGMQVAMAYLHVSVYLALGESVSVIYTIGGLFFLLGVPFWNKFAAVKGKHVALITGLSLNVILFIALGMLKPSHSGALLGGRPLVFWEYMLIFCSLNFSQVVYFSMPPAIIGDIAEAATLETKEDQSGTYFAVYTFVYKLVLGIGQGLALFIAGSVFGFDPKVVEQVDKAATGIKLMMGYMPAALVVVAIVVLIGYPITKKKQRETQEKIKELDLTVQD